MEQASLSFAVVTEYVSTTQKVKHKSETTLISAQFIYKHSHKTSPAVNHLKICGMPHCPSIIMYYKKLKEMRAL